MKRLIKNSYMPAKKERPYTGRSKNVDCVKKQEVQVNHFSNRPQTLVEITAVSFAVPHHPVQTDMQGECPELSCSPSVPQHSCDKPHVQQPPVQKW